jgi:DNA repair photolyase
MEMTVGELYRPVSDDVPIIDMATDTDLKDIFNAKRSKRARSAQEFLQEHRKAVVDKIAYWTGVQRPLVKRLVEAIENRIGELGLLTDSKRESEHLAEITVYASALAMNYLANGKFVQP